MPTTATQPLLSSLVLGYTKERDPKALAALLSRGVVFASRQAAAAASPLCAGDAIGPVLLDPATYEKWDAVELRSQSWPLTLEGLPDWLDRQISSGVDLVLTPAGFVAWNKPNQLRAAIEYGAQCREVASSWPCALTLVLDNRWLEKSAAEVADELAAVDAPIALVLSALYDPLKSPHAISGLRHLIESVPQLVLLRSDLHGLGAIAHGAAAAAIGTNPTLRHLHPPWGSRRGKAKVRDPSPVVLAKPLGRYGHGAVLQQVEHDQGLLTCDLEACCDGRPLHRFGAPDEHGTLHLEALLHNLATTNAIADEVLVGSQGTRISNWREYCREAYNANQELYRRSRIGPLRPPAYLEAWAEM